MDEAGALLGHHYFIDGTVVQGAGRGRELGVPTANLATLNELVPPAGVYATLLTVDDIVFPSVTNIGMRPTFGDVEQPVIETHVLDFDRDLYGIDRAPARSSSGCATSAHSPTSTRCARRSTPTAAARAGCSAVFRCRIVRYVSIGGSRQERPRAAVFRPGLG